MRHRSSPWRDFRRTRGSVGAHRGHPRRIQPTVEGLEGRSLLSVGLDTSFGSGGMVTGSLGSTNASAIVEAVAVQPDGKIVVAGTRMNNTYALAVERFNANGSVDTTFGTGGVVVAYDGNHVLGSTSGIAGQSGVADRVLIQPDGKIVVAGTVYGKNGGAEQGAVFRLNPNGSPDTSFGSGGTFVNSGPNASQISSLALGANGKIVLLGSSVERLDPNGTLDATFGTGGILPIPTPPQIVSSPPFTLAVSAVAVQPDGKVILAGLSSEFLPDGSPSMGEAARLNVDGTLDRGFGNAGFASSGVSAYNDVTIQPGGLIDLVGSIVFISQHPPFPDAVIVQLNPDGSVNHAFGTHGSGSASFAPAFGNLTAAIAIQADGQIVAADLDPNLTVARLTVAGTSDLSFAPNGLVNFPVQFPNNETETGKSSLAIEPDGKIIVVGSASNATQPGIHPVTSGFVIARLNVGNTPGDYLGTGVTDPAIYLPGLNSVAIQPGSPLIPFGIAGPGQTLPAPGDYDGSGKTELGVYLPSLDEFAYRPANGGPDKIIPFGIGGPGQTLPAPGDYFGTGQTDIAAYLPILGAFALLSPTGQVQFLPFGIIGAGQSIPAPGDYDGSGKTELAVYLPSLGAFAYRSANGGPDQIIPFGIKGAGQSIPMPGDYDGSGKTELAVYLPALGKFAYRPANGGPDVIESFGIAGPGQTLPMPGDYDGSGHTELGVYLPALGKFAYRPASGGPDVIATYGIAGAGQTLPFNEITATNPPSTLSPTSLDFVPDLDPIHKHHS